MALVSLTDVSSIWLVIQSSVHGWLSPCAAYPTFHEISSLWLMNHGICGLDIHQCNTQMSNCSCISGDKVSLQFLTRQSVSAKHILTRGCASKLPKCNMKLYNVSGQVQYSHTCMNVKHSQHEMRKSLPSWFVASQKFAFLPHSAQWKQYGFHSRD